MFMGGWLESSKSSITLPFDLDLMQIFIDYLYTDELSAMESVVERAINYSSVKSRTEKEIELAMNVYVLSDQLLVEHLKSLCEFKLVYLVSLKNVGEMLEFATQYSAQQLRQYCMEFCARNLVTLVDSRLLESLGQELLNDLSQFYRFNLLFFFSSFFLR